MSGSSSVTSRIRAREELLTKRFVRRGSRLVGRVADVPQHLPCHAVRMVDRVKRELEERDDHRPCATVDHATAVAFGVADPSVLDQLRHVELVGFH